MQDGKRQLLRHALATVAYRGSKAVGGAPAGFAAFQPGPSSRTPVQIVAHLGDLFDWALTAARSAAVWHEPARLDWDGEVGRFFAALGRLDAYLASDEPLASSAEALLQGPVADALTHVGQLTMLRRLAGAPIRGESYFRAEMVAGRVGPDQATPRVEFD